MFKDTRVAVLDLNHGGIVIARKLINLAVLLLQWMFTINSSPKN